MVDRLGLTDLERAKYLPDATRSKSVVRVSQDGPIAGIESPVDVNVLGPVSISGQPISVEQATPVDVNILAQPIGVAQGSPFNVTLLGQPISVEQATPVDVNILAQPIGVLQATYPVLPDKSLTHRILYFQDGASPDQHLAIGTLAAPILFKVEVTKKSLIDRIDLGIVFASPDTTLTSVLQYGSLVTGLVNGIQFVTKKAGAEVVVFNIQRMIHWTHFTRTGLNTPIDLKGANTEQTFQISLVMRNIFTIDPGQYIAFKIRDNMTTLGLVYQRASVLVEEIE